MRVGIISSQQLAETGRFDAFFNLVYKEYRDEALAIIAVKSKDDMITAAKALPFDKYAARVRAGSSIVTDFERWTEIELVLYLLQLRDKDALKQAEESIRAEAERRLGTIALAMKLLSTEKG